MKEEHRLCSFFLHTNKKGTSFEVPREYLLVRLGCVHLLLLEHLLSSKSLVLLVLDCGWLFKIPAHFELSDDAFFFNHSLETSNDFLDRFIGIYGYICHTITHPLCLKAQESN